MNDHLSGWTDWQEAFTDWTDISISELHGLMTGLMTACDAPTADAWAKMLEELSFSQLDDDALELLTEEAEDLVFQLKDKEDAYQYAPLVPDDEHDLYERVQALKDWTNGYLTGIGVADMSLSDKETETLSDLAKIGGIRIEPDDEFEGGEESYLHLYEFARMVPVSLATRRRKPLLSLPIIAGLPLGAMTVKEQQAQKNHLDEHVHDNIDDNINDNTDDKANHIMPPVIDAMNKRPS